MTPRREPENDGMRSLLELQWLYSLLLMPFVVLSANARQQQDLIRRFVANWLRFDCSRGAGEVKR